jgi:hypothetical protein
MVLSDREIASLLQEPKQPVDPAAMLLDLKPASVGASRVAVRTVPSAAGGVFVLRVRQNLLDPYDFSIILSYAPAGGAEVILRRHNGPSHAHRNPIEGTSFAGVCHIHEATERYQLRESKAEHYAEPTQRFSDVATGLACMLADANFGPLAQSPFPGL